MSYEIKLDKGILEKIMLKNTTPTTTGTQTIEVTCNNFSRVETPDLLLDEDDEEKLDNDTSDDEENVEIDNDLGFAATVKEDLSLPIVQVLSIQNIAASVVLSKSNSEIKLSSSYSSSTSLHSSNEIESEEQNKATKSECLSNSTRTKKKKIKKFKS